MTQSMVLQILAQPAPAAAEMLAALQADLASHALPYHRFTDVMQLCFPEDGPTLFSAEQLGVLATAVGTGLDYEALFIYPGSGLFVDIPGGDLGRHRAEQVHFGMCLAGNTLFAITSGGHTAVALPEASRQDFRAKYGLLIQRTRAATTSMAYRVPVGDVWLESCLPVSQGLHAQLVEICGAA